MLSSNGSNKQESIVWKVVEADTLSTLKYQSEQQDLEACGPSADIQVY